MQARQCLVLRMTTGANSVIAPLKYLLLFRYLDSVFYYQILFPIKVDIVVIKEERACGQSKQHLDITNR